MRILQQIRKLKRFGKTKFFYENAAKFSTFREMRLWFRDKNFQGQSRTLASSRTLSIGKSA